MDELMFYSQKKKQIDILVNTTRIFSKDIRME